MCHDKIALLAVVFLFSACPDEPAPLSPTQQKRMDALLKKSSPEVLNAEIEALQKKAGERMDELKALETRQKLKANEAKAP